jgi:hypothetical protein
MSLLPKEMTVKKGIEVKRGIASTAMSREQRVIELLIVARRGQIRAERIHERSSKSPWAKLARAQRENS